jgi:23S rRNA pseudouridine1911/1915/1917 synthase
MRSLLVTQRPKEARLDKFVPTRVNSLTRTQTKKLVNQGLITVNGKTVDPSYEVRRGDKIAVELPAVTSVEIKPENLPLSIIFEDKDILVLDKVAGMVSHPSKEHISGTLVNALLYHFGKNPFEGDSLRPGIVHRLDKGTSGLMVVAKNQAALENLKKEFKHRRVVKKYLALVQGRLEPAMGEVKEGIARHPKNRQKFAVSPLGKEALTLYKVLENFGGTYSLVEAEPKTGRTHQIRVHLAALGHPIVGDRLYGGKPAARPFLHASSLTLAHPRTGQVLKFESKLPPNLQELLNKIKLDLRSVL